MPYGVPVSAAAVASAVYTDTFAAVAGPWPQPLTANVDKLFVMIFGTLVVPRATALLALATPGQFDPTAIPGFDYTFYPEGLQVIYA